MLFGIPLEITVEVDSKIKGEKIFYDVAVKVVALGEQGNQHINLPTEGEPVKCF